MAGWIGVGLALMAMIALFVSDPPHLLTVHAPGAPELAYAALLLCIAALASLLGLLSPAWSVSRQAAIWSAVAAAIVTVATNIDAVASAITSTKPEIRKVLPVPTPVEKRPAVRLRERTQSIFGDSELEIKRAED